MPTVGDLQKPENISILIYGPSGSGKSLLGMTLGSGLTIIDLDGNLITGATYRDAHMEHRKSCEVIPCMEKNPKRPTAFSLANAKVDEIADAGPNWPQDAIMVDSLTALCNAAMLQCQSEDGWKKSGSGGPTMGQYGAFGVKMINFLQRLHAIPKLVILTAHDTEVWQDDTEGVKMYVPGKMLPPQIPVRFTEIWYMQAVATDDSTEDAPKYTRQLVTNKTASIFACSRLQVPDRIDVNQGLPGILERVGINFPRRPLA